jgi:hypothetical protein
MTKSTVPVNKSIPSNKSLNNNNKTATNPYQNFLKDKSIYSNEPHIDISIEAYSSSAKSSDYTSITVNDLDVLVSNECGIHLVLIDNC